ncbi:hypothetical protein GCM10027590_42600 [Nocardiopsis nanhaiensis]
MPIAPLALPDGSVLIIDRYPSHVLDLAEQRDAVCVVAAERVAVIPPDRHVCLCAEIPCGAVGEQGGEQVGPENPDAE